MASFTPAGDNSSWTPPPPPPKPGSHEASAMGTPMPPPSSSSYYAGPPPPPPPPPAGAGSTSSTPWQQKPPHAADGRELPPLPSGALPQHAHQQHQQPPSVPDPGEKWLPQILQDKSKQDLAALVSNPALLDALTHSPDTIHPSLSSSHESLRAALSENIELATHVASLESHLSSQRASAQAQLLATHALERQWRQKQSDMDHALAPFAPASLYQRLAQGVQEQAAVCQAMEESFLDAGGDGAGGGAGGGGTDGVPATEREVADWVRRYREARVQYYLRHERKERWDEGRVGGWR